MAASARGYGQLDVPGAEEHVKFGAGQPCAEMLPLDKIRQAAASKFAETDEQLLQYGDAAGYKRFRQSLAAFLSRRYNKPVEDEGLFATQGVTGAISLLSSVTLRSGDTVVVEAPTYFIMRDMLTDMGIKLEEVPMQPDGMDVAALETKLRAGLRPKWIYTIPVHHNPSGATMSAAKRRRLVELAAEFDFFIVADEVYQLLGFDPARPPPPPLVYTDLARAEGPTSRVISVGSFSKILAPALRLGWLHCASGAPILERLSHCGTLESGGGMNPVVQGIVQATIDLGLQDEHLDATASELALRSQALSAALAEHVEPLGASARPAQGGYFLWLELPAGWDAEALLRIAQARHRVSFVPGHRFGSGLENAARLSFSWYDKEGLALGAARLAGAMAEYSAARGRSQPA